MSNGLLPSALVVAAIPLPSLPAQAQRWSDPAFLAAANVSVHRSGPPSSNVSSQGHRIFTQGPAPARQHHRGRDGDFGGGGVYYDSWEWQGDTAWRPNSYNDWWHESPRSFPRWMQSNQDCQRLWWSGGGWRC